MSSAARPDPAEAPEERRFLSTAEAAALERELLEDYRFGRQQLVELCGHASAVAVTKEYEPTIFYPTRSLDLLHRDLTTQCEKMDIPFLSYLPTEVQLINDAYGLVVDAVLGPGVQPGEIGGPCTRALATLKLLSIPLAGTRRPAAATPRMGSAPTCWYRSPRPSAAPAASPAATTSWPAGSCPTTCAESSLSACRDTRAPTASRRCDRHPRPGGLDPRQ
ncbi:yjeF N-terminal domain-containing protein 3 isoform X3 [Ursus americanus]|uniref:yjeF N-terminal domain-containing protein 3 isoform X3 n=1 Tax=Ursus americanus TaxID=9643 RepID=UPI000E6DBAED|nr:yjeF N-terminal domain-containing protein 3 isoform X3 [Ursus americanus]